jgi:hypothetical protein
MSTARPTETFNPIYDSIGHLTVVKKFTQDDDQFDVWAKRWNAETDDFEWRRFAGCTWDWKGDGRRPRVTHHDYPGLEGWRAVWWVEIPRPPDVKSTWLA